MPKVSIIMPVYNAESTLKRCIESVLNQTYEDFEFIIVNDGSTDRTKTALQTYAKDDSRIKVFTQANQGPSSARNRGIQSATGDYIFFIDSDDYWEVTLLNKVMNFIQRESLDVAIFGYFIEREGGVPKQVTESRKVIRTNSSRNVQIHHKEMLGFGCNKAYKASLLRENKVQFSTSIAYGEDAIFNAEVFKIAKVFGFLDEAFYHYVQYNSGTLSRKYADNLAELDVMSNKAFDSILKSLKVSKHEIDVFSSQNTYARAKWSIAIIATTDQSKWRQKQDGVRDILSNYAKFVNKAYLSRGAYDKLMTLLFDLRLVKLILVVSSIRAAVVKFVYSKRSKK